MPTSRIIPAERGREKTAAPGRDGRVGRLGRVSPKRAGAMAQTAQFLARYVVLPERTRIVAAAWVLSAWLSSEWDRFPHLAITSPEKRCGKTRFLQLLTLIVPNPQSTANISPAAIYRLIESRRPTLLLDEAQSISRRSSEAAEIIRELLNAAIDRDAKVIRVGGKRMDEIQEFSVYSPKAVALIGSLDGVLADRCLPVEMARKTEADQVEPYRSRLVEPIGAELRARLEEWVETNRDEVASVYDRLEPFDIANDRMAELLLPLQAVLTVDDPDLLDTLKEYADALDEKDREAERMSSGVLLLTACKDVFSERGKFVPTAALIEALAAREEEPWARYTRGGKITPEALSKLLRPYGIQSQHNKAKTKRGYFAHAFREAWSRYLPPPEKPVRPVLPVPSSPG